MNIFLCLWGLVGAVTWGICVYREGELIVDDLKMVPLMVFLGPIPLVVVWFQQNNNTTLWKKKNNTEVK